MIRRIALLAACLFTTGAFASNADSIKASHAWIRVLPAGLPAGGYVELENTGAATIMLTGVAADHYAHAMLHMSTTEGGMGRMAMVDKLELPGGKTTRLSPGGYHVMLTDAKTPVQAGDTVHVTLKFADGSTIDVPFLAKPANAVE